MIPADAPGSTSLRRLRNLRPRRDSFVDDGATDIDFSPYFVGVTEVAAERIFELSNYAPVAVAAMKYVARQQVSDLDDLTSALRRVGRGDRIHGFLRAVATYVLGASTSETRMRIIEATKGTPAEEAVVTIAESLRKEGRTEGELNAQRSVLIRQLARRFGITPEEADLVNSTTDRERLDAALDEFAVARSKEQVLGKLNK